MNEIKLGKWFKSLLLEIPESKSNWRFGNKFLHTKPQIDFCCLSVDQ